VGRKTRCGRRHTLRPEAHCQGGACKPEQLPGCKQIRPESALDQSKNLPEQREEKKQGKDDPGASGSRKAAKAVAERAAMAV
jgi:hypothetical protein